MGTDGDEFHSIVVWKDGTLVLDITEIEGGKQLESTEIWSLTDGGKGLKRVRQTAKSGAQMLVYLRTK
jgi:DNA gyrase/topoisomerase IV subunit A